MKKILYIQAIHPAGMNLLREKYEVAVAKSTDLPNLLEEIRDASVIVARLTRVDRELIDGHPDLLTIPMPLFRARAYSNTSFTFPRTVLKSFRVEVQETSGGAWRTVYETDSNHQRLVRGAIDRDVVAVRLMPLSTWGSERLNNTYDSAVAHIFAFDLA